MPALRQRKIALMGFREVGKSSLVIQFVQGQFVDSYDPTIENTFTKRVNVGGSDYELSLVDTAGQDEYTKFPAEYSLDVNGYVLVYSIDSMKSFEVCHIIHEKLVGMVGTHGIPLVLVGNKSDLHMDRRVTIDEGRQLAGEMNAVFLETSAKENQGVRDIFTRVVAEMERTDGGDAPESKKQCRIS